MSATAYDPHDRAAWLAEAQAEAAAFRLEAFLGRRPERFACPGQLRDDVQAWMDGYLAGRCGSLILTGEVGTGKTWHLWKLSEMLIRSGWKGHFRIATTYDVKMATDRPVDHERLSRWREADLYAIDDLGSCSVNDWTADAISELVDSRWQNRRPTVIATNLSGKGIRDVLGARAASRLGDGTTVVKFTGEDRRRGGG